MDGHRGQRAGGLLEEPVTWPGEGRGSPEEAGEFDQDLSGKWGFSWDVCFFFG